MRAASSGARGDFPETRLTLLHRLAFGADAERVQAAEEFWLNYREPLLVHLICRFHMSRPAAEDALHDFYQRKFAPQGRPCLLAHFEEQRGSRFRNFLMKSLERFVLDQFRRLHGPRHAPDVAVALKPDAQGRGGSVAATPSQIFDYAWAAGLLARAVELMQHRAMESGSPVLWDVFRLRFLDPAVSGARPITFKDCAILLGLGGTTAAFRTCEQARTLFRECLFALLAEYVDGTGAIHEELADLIASLSSVDFGLPEETVQA